MKEVSVAKLDKEDQKKFREFEKERQEAEEKVAYIHSAWDFFWEGLRTKYKLPYGKRHYIKDKAIYRADD